MKTVDRYITLTVATHFVFALAVLLAVFSVINLTQELESVRAGQYGVRHALWFVIATLPNEAYELFPAAALVGSVAGLGALASRNELVAILAAGVSPARLTCAVMQAASALVVVAVLLGEFAAAPLAQRARAQRSVAISGGTLLSTARGIWARDGSRFVNIRTPLIDGELRDLYVFDFDDRQRMRRFTYARTASYANEQWTLEQLVENRIADDGVTTERVPRQAWGRFVDPRQLQVLFLPPDELSLVDLHRSIASLAKRGESTERHELAFWRRVTMPIVTGIMVLLGLPFVFTVQPGAGAGARIVAGVLAGIGFQMFTATFGRLGLAYGLNAILTAIFPGLLALGCFLWWLAPRCWAARPG